MHVTSIVEVLTYLAQRPVRDSLHRFATDNEFATVTIVMFVAPLAIAIFFLIFITANSGDDYVPSRRDDDAGHGDVDGGTKGAAGKRKSD
jgi:hypothetical protein